MSVQITSAVPLLPYTEEEKKLIVQYVMELKGDLIRGFLEKRDIPKSGTKPALRKKIEKSLEEEATEYQDLVRFLDEVAPWGKQHIFFYRGSEVYVKQWKDEKYAHEVFSKNNLTEYLDAGLPLILPVTLSLSLIEYTPRRSLKICAVEKIEHWERNHEFDEVKEKKGTIVELRAYIHQITRGCIIFSWDLVSNNAILQVLQLPSGSKYEEAEERFVELISPWFKFDHFQKLDLKPVINRLQEFEESGNPEARSHGIGYRTLGGRVVSAQSSTPRDSVLGERVVDGAMKSIRREGVGHHGNFYWLVSSVNHNPLQKELHTVILANKQRINFTTPNKKEDIEYVLTRVRALIR